MIGSYLWDLKVRLQFTGWLQYLPTALLSVLFFLFAGLANYFGTAWLTGIFVTKGAILFVILIFDLITVKFRLRFPEKLPQRQENLNLFDLMRARRSCRSFQLRKLTPSDYDALMHTVEQCSKAPTIGCAPIRFEYIAAPLTVWPVVNASEFLVAIAPKKYNRFAVIDVGRSLQKIVMAATRMGLGTCWIGPGADHASILRHLGDRFNPEVDHIICVCAVGYKSRYMPLLVRGMNKKMSQRLPLASLFFADAHFAEPLAVDSKPFNRFGRTYEICQWSPSSFNGQTTRCVGRVDPNKDVARFDFYAATNSRFYAPVALGIWCANWELGCEALGINGCFTQLSAEERSAQDENSLPKYDVSWIAEAAV